MPTGDTTSDNHISPFESIKHTDEHGVYWFARELANVLEYALWQNLEAVIERAKLACANSGRPIEHHFINTNRVIPGGRWGKQTVKDVQLSRYACYLVVQNADPSKETVALGQTYFTIRTRHDELAQEHEETRLRLEEREKLKRYHRDLFKAARDAGVVNPEDFAIFEDHGYQGLYNGETTRDIAARKRLTPRQSISDYMGSTELAANGFRAALAREMLRGEGVDEKDAANATHHRSGRLVRKAMEDAGVTPPEQLPTPTRSIQQLKREGARRRQIEEEDRLGLFAQLNLPTSDDAGRDN